MKVLHVIDSLNAVTGGPALSATRLADAQAEAGAEVEILGHLYREHGEPLLPRQAAVTTLPARRRPFRLGASAAGWKALLEARVPGCDMLHLHGIWLPSIRTAHTLAARLGVPRTVSTRGMLEPWAWDHRRFRKRLAWTLYEQRLLEAVQLLHATSPQEAENLRRRGLHPPICRLPNGVDPPGPPVPREKLEEAFPPLRGTRWLLFLSRIHRKKGIDLLLDAWRAAGSARNGWVLILAGESMDGELARLRRAVSGRYRQEGILPVGVLQGELKASALHGCEALVLPTRSENFGHAIGEALAHGKPVLTTNATPWSQIREAGAGWIFPPETAAFRTALLECLQSAPETLQAMGAHARKLIDRDFQWPAIGRKMLSAYAWAAGRDRQRPSSILLD